MKNNKSYWLLLPCMGCLLFVVFYVIAAALYPGGYYEDLNAKGFSWRHNYWCNLLNEHSLNREINTARPVAITGMIELAITLLCFWTVYPMQMKFRKTTRIAIQLSGFLSIAAISFLSTSLHDISITVSGFFALIAMAGAFVGIYNMKWFSLFAFGMVTLLLVATNNYIYYSQHWFYYLPVVQKITFLCCLLWISLVNLKLYKLPVSV